MYKELRDNMLMILSDLPSESSVLDYKICPYDKNHKASFIKDVCAFLNCTESYGKNKYIIIGVVDKTKYKKGINQNRMEDDKYYQDLLDMLQPRPHVETGEIEVNGLFFGYIFISKDNTERVYSIIKDYPSETVTREEEANGIKTKVYASTAYIRRGSVNNLLNEYDRRRIYEQDKNVKKEENIHSYTNELKEVDKDILRICALFGTWSENNEAEKEIIDSVIGLPYDKWIKVLKNLLIQKSEFVSFKNGQWRINKKEELIERYAEEYFQEEIQKFEKAVLKVLNEVNPKFDLKSEDRMMSNVLGNSATYSKSLKKSILETIAYIKSIDHLFINCEKEINNMQWCIVRDALQKITWKKLATLNDLLPLLAEINEKEYLRQIDDLLRNGNEELSKLFDEKEYGITATGYTYGLYWSLELISWNPNFIMDAFSIFGKLAKYDPKVVETMARILLPWYPQTEADIVLRRETVKMLLKENEEVGWKLLMELMPHKQTHTLITYKPKWNNVISEEEIKVTNKELHEQTKGYVELAILYSRTNKERIIELIKLLDDVSKDIFETICEKLVSDEVNNIVEKERFYIWNELEDLIEKHKNNSERDWALPEEAIDELVKISNILEPKSKEIYYKRLFDDNFLKHFNNKDSFEAQEKKLLIEQKTALEELLKLGISNIIEFAETTKDTNRVGYALAEIELNNSDEKAVLQLLDDEHFAIAQGYVRRKFYKDGFEWVNNTDIKYLSIIGKVRLLVQLPNNKDVWDKVKQILGDKEDEYWKEVDIRFVEKNSEYDYPIEKLLENKRPVKAIELIGMALHEKRNFSNDLAIIALNEALNAQDNITYIDQYSIKSIIKYLQENNYNPKELFKVEWGYLPMLTYDEDYRPITIEKTLSEEPSVFLDIICLAYKAKKDELNKENSDSKLALNAYNLLSLWKVVPGQDVNGYVDKTKLYNWFDEMKKIAIEKDRLEVSLLHFGQVLFYAPKDKDGSWIDNSVVELLNGDDAQTIRRGYSLEAFNSVGVVELDSEGTAWLNLEKIWLERANSIDIKYFRFIGTLKEIAEDFHNQAQHSKERFE